MLHFHVYVKGIYICVYTYTHIYITEKMKHLISDGCKHPNIYIYIYIYYRKNEAFNFRRLQTSKYLIFNYMS